jgi:hypothetical protein
LYLRHSRRVKNGKQHSYWRLVRSVRRSGKVIQETVAQLGELDAEGRANARLLAQQITGRAHQRELFEAAAPEVQRVAVRLDRVCIERARSFGGVWLGWKLWRALKLDELCAELMPEGREAVPWAQVAAVLVIARLTEPSSELHIAEAWYRTTALEDLLGLPAERVDDNRLYRALDRLLPHKPALEQHLRRRLGELFALEYDLLLYDVTSTYFGAPGQAWRIQRVKFPSRQGAKPLHRESSLGLMEVTTWAKRRQSDGRAVTQVKRLSLVSRHPQADRVEYLEGNSRRSKKAMTAGDCGGV